MSYSLSNAAAACGIYKSTVLRSIKSGRLTATKDALGQWRIEPAELHRVYPPVQSNGADGNATRHDATAALAQDRAALIVAQDRAEVATQRLADFKVLFEDCVRIATTGARMLGAWRWPMRGRGSHGGDALPVCRGCRRRNQISEIDSSARRASGDRLRLPLPAPAKQTYRTWRMAILLAHLNNLARFSQPRLAAHQWRAVRRH
jgi:hypothetical protein